MSKLRSQGRNFFDILGQHIKTEASKRAQKRVRGNFRLRGSRSRRSRGDAIFRLSRRNDGDSEREEIDFPRYRNIRRDSFQKISKTPSSYVFYATEANSPLLVQRSHHAKISHESFLSRKLPVQQKNYTNIFITVSPEGSFFVPLSTSQLKTTFGFLHHFQTN